MTRVKSTEAALVQKTLNIYDITSLEAYAVGILKHVSEFDLCILYLSCKST